jgi:hypothetical protein
MKPRASAAQGKRKSMGYIDIGLWKSAGKPVAKLIQYQCNKQARQLGALQGKIQLLRKIQYD